MIQIIGIMVGAYVFTRMAELIQSKDTHWLVKSFAVITLLVSMIGTVSLFFTGTPAAPR